MGVFFNVDCQFLASKNQPPGTKRTRMDFCLLYNSVYYIYLNLQARLLCSSDLIIGCRPGARLVANLTPRA
jgi:hypothetical protein